ncbi:Serine/threonine-protein kinase HT1 [Gossypium arboreum]|uniref:Serine/threonine-protein kinase HT1 n=1 Tax=Gossypium arboreum TaxID=29729 RepID=A0A0B0NR81_GOSAR|nr:Serine/threonine-protein kinase HT1 [Gossypium arboreum]
MATINGETAMEKALGSIGSFSNNNNKEVFLRADKIDFKSWDLQLDKHLSRAWSRDSDGSTLTKKEEWEIDLAKLDIRYVIAHGTYGTVYRGVYDTQDVAVKVLDWGEDGIATVAEAAALRASFRQEVAVWHKLDNPNVTKFIGASMGTSNLKIPTKDGISENNNSLPARACCVVVEYLPGGTLKNFLIRNRRKKLAFKNLRPEIPRCCPSSLASIIRKCWDAHPERRPDMDEVVRLLEAVDTSKGGGMIPDDQARGCFCFTARGP